MLQFISGNFLEGQKVTVKLNDKIYTRVVRYRKIEGLYIIIDNRMYFEYEVEY